MPTSPEPDLEPLTSKLNEPRHLTQYISLSEVALGIKIVQLSYNDVRRMLEVGEERVKDRGTDPIGKLLATEGANVCGDALDYLSGVSTLFQSGQLARTLGPKVLLAFDARDGLKLVGVCNLCRWYVDPALSTEHWTPAALEKEGLPKFTTEGWMFCDLICSVRSPSASLIAATAMTIAARQRVHRPIGLVVICINAKSHSTFRRLGFQSKAFRSKGEQRWICWCRIDSFKIEALLRRLRWEGNELALKLCYRQAVRGEAMIPRCR